MLSCTGLTVSVPGRVLCRDLTVAFEPGQVWAVLGRNGSGKSTLVHTLAGLAVPDSGAVELNGTPVAKLAAIERARAVGVLLQSEDGLYWGSVEEYVLLGRFPHARRWGGYAAEDFERARAALDAVGMPEFRSRTFASLSGGERQRVRIAQVLAQEPACLLLDEPLQHLDLAHQANVLQLVATRVRSRRDLAVMVLHEPLWIGRACTHAIVLAGDGLAQAGPADEILTRARLEHAYGCTLREVSHGKGRSFVPDV